MSHSARDIIHQVSLRITGIVSLKKFCYTITKYFISYYRSMKSSWLIVCCLQREDGEGGVVYNTVGSNICMGDHKVIINVPSLVKFINEWISELY